MVRAHLPQAGSFSIITNDENNPQNTALNPPGGFIPDVFYRDGTIITSDRDYKLDENIENLNLVSLVTTMTVKIFRFVKGRLVTSGA